jgi:acetyl-CoA carboxylase biotin carboxylase subunit
MDYDPLVSKLIAYASNRESAIERMLRALNEYYVCGIRTNLSLLERILRDSSFRMAEMDTGYLDRLLASENGEAWSIDDSIDSATVAAAAAALFQTLPANGASRDRNNGKGVAPQNGLQDRTWKRQARAEGLS